MNKLSDIVRRWPNHEAKQWVESFVRDAVLDDHVLAVVAFGSAVRSDDYCADIDLLVVHDGTKPLIVGRPVSVDIRWYERTDAERQIASGQELLGWVFQFGELVFERNNYWTRLRRDWKGRMPFPSASVADHRAERATRMHAELVEMGDYDAAHEQYLVALTQQARAALIRRGVYPASRPELPEMLRRIEETELANKLEETLLEREQA